MAKLTATQIAMVAWNIGIHDEPTMARAVAVALAESGGNTNAHNPNANTGDNSYGLWQINMLGAMGPARRKQFDIAKNEDLFNPATNAKAMMILSNYGRNWAPWSTFKNNAYMKHINIAKAAAKDVVGKAKAASPSNPLQHLFDVAGMAGNVVGGAVGSVASGLDIGGTITASVNSIGASFMRLGLNVFAVILASVLIILAIVIMLRAPLGKAASTVAGVAGPGKVGKAAGKFAKVVK